MIITKAIECFFSSDNDKKISNLVNLNFFFKYDFIFLLRYICGLPNRLFLTDISLKFKPFLKPVPRDFTNASFAANLFAKKLTLFLTFLEA